MTEFETLYSLNKKPKVVCDQREQGGVSKALDLMGADIEIRKLEVGDYVVSDRIGFERKSDDFFTSLFRDKTLFGQVKDLANAYERPILIIEGINPFASQASPQSIQAVLNSIAIDFGVATLYTKDAKDTAKLLYDTAMSEQFGVSRPIQLHGKRSHMSLSEQQEYVVSAVPGIGRKTAQELLKSMGSVQSVFSCDLSSEEAKANKKLINKTVAEAIHKMQVPYEPKDK